MKDRLSVAVLGASGYTGAELLRLLAGHPNVQVVALSADSQAGQRLGDVFPHLSSRYDLPLQRIEEIDFSNIDAVFCALPHGTTQEVVAALPPHLKIIDLSADFRLRNPETYAEWYGHPHRATEFQREAVYGLTEWNREHIRTARLIANPGCYPTATLLPLLPLLEAGLVEPDDIVVDAKSGVSGAGRSVKRELLFTELESDMSAYGIGRHRHVPEIEQSLTDAAGRPVEIRFTPHLIPISRGMLATIYIRAVQSESFEQIGLTLSSKYKNEPFVDVMYSQRRPHTVSVRTTNMCQIGVYSGRRKNDVVIVSAIDNLVKGASGQAIQNLNAMMGWPEATGLEGLAVFP